MVPPPRPPSPARPTRAVLVSACLVGETCRYDGDHNHRADLLEELSRAGLTAVPFCPEEEGGLGTPRPPAWIEARDAGAVLAGEDRIVTAGGDDVTEAFRRGARRALTMCRAHGIERAYLKERSPSCGVCHTHVAGQRVEGPGLTTAFLRRAGIKTIGVD